MAEYIDREAAVKAVKDYAHMVIDKGRKSLDTVDDTLNIVARIEKIPTADVVPVVRCKDCKWFVDNNGGEWYGCKMFQVVRITPEDAPKPDDFCSYGERMDGGAVDEV